MNRPSIQTQLTSISTAKKCSRIIALIDMDCFYVQVEKRLARRTQADWTDKPAAVVQYNSWRGGGIIAVDYLARAFGVKRGMRGDEATKLCPNLHLFQVPSQDQKADLSIYRDAGAEVIDVLSQFTNAIERASIDEAYIDLTEEILRRESQYATWTVEQFLDNFKLRSFVAGYENEDESIVKWISNLIKFKNNSSTGSGGDSSGGGAYGEYDDLENEEDNEFAYPLATEESFHKNDDYLHEWRLIIGACLVNEMRDAVEKETEFQCSAGIAHNKMLAKLACGINKPNKQTVLRQSYVPKLYETIPVKKVRGLGGKFGNDVCTKLNIEMMSQLKEYSEGDLQLLLGEKGGSWLYQLSRGWDDEGVKERVLAQSIGCSKNFPGAAALTTCESVSHWLKSLVGEVASRLKQDAMQNQRKARLLTVSVRFQDDKQQFISQSRCCELNKLDSACMFASVYKVLQEFNKSPNSSGKWFPSLVFLGVNASKFVTDCSADARNGSASILEMFTRLSSQQQAMNKNNKTNCSTTTTTNSSDLPCSSNSTNSSSNISTANTSANTIFLTKPTLPTLPLINKPPTPPKIGAIDKFLISSTSSISTAADIPVEGTEKCPQCGKMILLEDLEEHSDYHIAQKMQMEWNKQSTTIVATTTTTQRQHQTKSEALRNKKVVAVKRKAAALPVGNTPSILKHFKKM